ncbi:MAG: RND transporter, partial [Clostridia bacterium]
MMERFAAFLLKSKWKVVAFFILAVLLSGILIPLVSINYDLTQYLPDDSMSRKAISVLQDEFTYPGSAEVMVANVTVPQALAAKKKIASVKGVKNVMWLDDLVDINVPVDYSDKAVTEP